MTDKKIGWRPNTAKKYDPNDPHFDPMHPPDDCPEEALKEFWGEPDMTTEELPDGTTKYILHRPEGND